MKLRLCSSPSGLSFERAKALGRNFSDAHLLPEKTTSIALPVPGPLAERRTDFLFDYDVFPKAILRFEAEWVQAKRPMAVGDIIVQRANVPPIGFGLCLEFAVRISAIFRGENRQGFAYETLKGHAESGLSEFYFEEKDGQLAFTIHTFSKPGNWLGRVLRHVATLPYQAWCTRRALRHVKARFIAENASRSPVEGQ